MVIVISTDRDVHSKEVMGYLERRGVESLLLDIQKFPTEIEIGLKKIDNSEEALLFYSGREIDLKDVISFYYRRPVTPLARLVGNHDVEEYVARESLLFLEALPKIVDKFWVSDPDAVRVSSRKPFQLLVAKKLGFSIPKSAIGNSPKLAADFLDLFEPEAEFAVKPVGRSFVRFKEGDKNYTTFTQRLNRKEILENIERVKNCPLIFQEYIQKDFELRITVVDNKAFACAIYSQKSEKTKTDWRRYDISNTPHEVFSLPSEIKQKCLALVRQLGLEFGCIDMIVTSKGEFVFLEINPVGQWLWIEELIGLPITEAVADILMGGGINRS